MSADEELKLYCIFSRASVAKMGGNRGKLAAQAGHAFLHAWWDATSHDHTFDAAEQYFEGTTGRAAKITLLCDTDEQLDELYEEHRANHGATRVVDAGRTVFKEPTLTCVGVGPIRASERSELLASLKVFI